MDDGGHRVEIVGGRTRRLGGGLRGRRLARGEQRLLDDHASPRRLPRPLPPPQPQVERHDHRSQPPAAVQRLDEGPARREREAHAVSLGHPRRRERARGGRGPGVELSVGQRPGGVDQRGPVAHRRRRAGQPGRDSH